MSLMADLSFSVNSYKQHTLLPILDTLAELYHMGQSVPSLPSLAETSNMDLRTLLEVLFPLGIAAVKEFFESHAYRISQPCKGTRFEDVVVGIKYIDGLNNLWRPKWAREARGRFYYYDTTTQKVLTLKDTLQRGVEVLTHAHTKATITETQDMKLGAYEHLDDIQQACIAAFQKDTPVDAYLSAKVDGSLLLVSAYPRGTSECKIMEEILEVCGDSFSKRLAEVSKDALLVVSTQGTLLIAECMQDYFLTALQSLLGPINSMKDWEEIAPRFAEKVHAFLNVAGLKGRTHLCFEAYCKGRRTFKGHLHTELAIEYGDNGLNLLGAMVDGRYIPHFDLPTIVFQQPMSLHLSSSQQAFAILEDMDKVVQDQMMKEVFLERWDLPDRPIHMEGWVLLTPTPAGYDYAKIKTPLYYKCHKVRSQEVPNLLALPTSCDATYPILRVLREFNNNAADKFNKSLETTLWMLELEIELGPSSDFYAALPEKARARFGPEPEKKDVAMKMIMSVCGTLFEQRIKPLLQEIWDIEGDALRDLISLIRHIMTKHMPWRTSLREEVRKEAMRDLYGILVESQCPP